MPIVAADIQTRYSGGAANADPNASLGGAKSATSFATAVANNLYDDVAGSESAAGDIEYRGFYAHNAHATLTLQGPVIWVDADTTSAQTEMDIAIAAEGVNVQMAGPLANEGTAPASVTFSHPTSKATGLALGDLPPGQGRGVWTRRTINVGAAAINDSGSFRIEGDTQA